MFSEARLSMRPVISTRNNPTSQAEQETAFKGSPNLVGNILGGIGLLKRLRQPSEKRAAKVVPGLLASAHAGNALAARAIVDRTKFGIAKERAVWAAAAAQLSSDEKLAATKLAAHQVALIDHSTPESAARSALANAVDVAQLASPTSARAKAGSKKNGEEAAPRAPAKRRAAPRARAPKRAPKPRLYVRYDPDPPHSKVRVPTDDERYDVWPSRKPARARSSKAQTKARQRATRAVTSAADRLVKKGLGAAASLGLGNVALVGAAGAVAYLATKAIIDGQQEGETVPNFVARARSQAATIFQREMQRAPTRSEYATLRERVGNIIGDAIRAQTGSLSAKWRNFITLFK